MMKELTKHKLILDWREFIVTHSMEEILSNCLTDSLNIMVCSESSNVSSSILTYVGRYPAFKLHRASSEKMLKMYLNQDIIWHTIIIDNHISFSKELFEEISKLSKWVPIISLSENAPANIWKNWSIEEISQNKFRCINKKDAGSGSVIEVLGKSGLTGLLSSILANSLKKCFFYEVPDKSVNEAANVLYKHNPVTVDEWAKLLGVCSRKIQRILKPFTKYSPKKMLSIYHAYRMAFSNVDNIGNLQCDNFAIHKIENKQKNRFLEYVLSRRSSLLNFSIS